MELSSLKSSICPHERRVGKFIDAVFLNPTILSTHAPTARSFLNALIFWARLCKALIENSLWCCQFPVERMEDNRLPAVSVVKECSTCLFWRQKEKLDSRLMSTSYHRFYTDSESRTGNSKAGREDICPGLRREL
jgi:hypothetical protein